MLPCCLLPQTDNVGRTAGGGGDLEFVGIIRLVLACHVASPYAGMIDPFTGSKTKRRTDDRAPRSVKKVSMRLNQKK